MSKKVLLRSAHKKYLKYLYEDEYKILERNSISYKTLSNRLNRFVLFFDERKAVMDLTLEDQILYLNKNFSTKKTKDLHRQTIKDFMIWCAANRFGGDSFNWYNTVGKFTYGHQSINHIPLGGGSYTIGKFCSIALNVKIYTGKGGHRKEFVTTFPFGFLNKEIFEADPSTSLLKDEGNVIIENDVWIGQNSTIMPNVRIGSGSIVANNSHVVKSCPPYSIIGGNPAVIIKKRFSETQIRKLLKIKWWDWSNKKINKNLALMLSKNVDEFISQNYLNHGPRI